MKPARIKQITTEMVIAWGMICMGFIVYDNITHNLLISPLNSCGILYTGRIGSISFLAINNSTMLSTFVSLWVFRNIISPILGIKFAGLIFNSLLIIFQFLLYWYAGNLLGRFFAWIHTKFHPEEITKPQEETQGPDQPDDYL